MHYARNMKTMITYKVSGLTCGSCVNRVKSTLADFADEVEVTLTPPEVKVHNPKGDLESLNEALASAGNYQLTPFVTKAEVAEPQPINTPNVAPEEAKNWVATYKPLLLVFVYIILATLAVEVSHGDFMLSRWMPHFMAGFFLVFSFFKLLDLAGFASSYAMYDLLAQKWASYGFVYPFIELGLGLAYLLQWEPIITNWATLIIMSFSTIGVVLAVMKKQAIKCACLGTGFNLPMSTVTIIEDLLMVAMALLMLFIPSVFL